MSSICWENIWNECLWKWRLVFLAKLRGLPFLISLSTRRVYVPAWKQRERSIRSPHAAHANTEKNTFLSGRTNIFVLLIGLTLSFGCENICVANWKKTNEDIRLSVTVSHSFPTTLILNHPLLPPSIRLLTSKALDCSCRQLSNIIAFLFPSHRKHSPFSPTFHVSIYVCFTYRFILEHSDTAIEYSLRVQMDADLDCSISSCIEWPFKKWSIMVLMVMFGWWLIRSGVYDFVAMNNRTNRYGCNNVSHEMENVGLFDFIFIVATTGGPFKKPSNGFST